MTAFFSAAFAFIVANKAAILGFVIVVAPSVITGLTAYPKAAGFVGFVKMALNIASLLSHSDSPGTFKLPFTFSQPPPVVGSVVGSGVGPTSSVSSLRGFVRLSTLALIAFAALFIATAAHAQTAPAPAPAPAADPSPLLGIGGCFAKGKWCVHPDVAVSIAAINLRTKTIEGAFAPGLGIGFTYQAGQWFSFGLGGYLNVDPAAQNASAALQASVLNGWAHVGYSKGFIGDTAPRVLLGIGLPPVKF